MAAVSTKTKQRLGKIKRKWKTVDLSNMVGAVGVGGFGGLEELNIEDFQGEFQDFVQQGENDDDYVSVPVETDALVEADAPIESTKKGQKRKKRQQEEDEQSLGNKIEDQQISTKKAKKQKKTKQPREDETLLDEETKTKNQNKKQQKIKKKHKNEKKKPTKKSEKQTQLVDNGENQTQTGGDESVDMYAWDQFNLHPQIIKALSHLKFTTPTPIQQHCLPPAINGHCDIIGAAQTGSGKTLAFGLPIIQQIMDLKLIDPENKSLKALIVAPTRELVMQVCAHLQAIAKFCKIQVSSIVGGISPAKQERILKKKPEIIVGTPGRLWELMSEGNEHLGQVENLRFFVLDEADRMMQMGLFKELTNIMDMLPYPQNLMEQEELEAEYNQQLGIDDDNDVGDEEDAEQQQRKDDEIDENIEDDENSEDQKMSDEEEDDNPQNSKQNLKKSPIQTFIFSATLTLPANLKSRLRKGKDGGAGGKAPTLESLLEQLQFRGKPKIVDLTPSQKVAEKVQESYMQCLESNRDSFVYYIVANHTGRTLVFCTSIAAVRRMVEILKQLGIGVWGLHAQQQQRQRLKNLDRFRNDPKGVLVATDVAARGLDIQDVQCVVHYQLPASADTYIHRAGRTARVEAEGISIALVSPKEAPRFRALIFALQRKKMPPEFPIDSSLLPKVMERVKLAEEIMLLERNVKGAKSTKSWLQKSVADLDLEMSGDEDSDGGTQQRTLKKNEHKASSLRQKLLDLLSEPLVTNISKKFLAGGQLLENGDKVTSGVKIAEKLAAHQKSAVIASKSKKQQQQQLPNQKKQKKLSLKKQKEAALQEAIDKKISKKAGKRKFFTVSSKTIAGRQESGPNALETLKRKLELLQ